jgi:uncharacterized membrane protein
MLSCLLACAVAYAAGYDDLRYPRDVRGNASIVTDPDAHDGKTLALRVDPGKTQPAYLGLASFTPRSGIYEYSCRMKITAPGGTDIVCNLGHTPDGTNLNIKGTDFAAIDTYQEFTITFTKKVQGGRMDLCVMWPGKVNCCVDWHRLRLVRAFTDEEGLKAAGETYEPAAWVLPPATTPRVLIGKGLWWEFFGLREAPAWMGAVTTSVWHAGPGGELIGFPKTPEALMQYNLVILADVGAYALTIRQRMMLKDYVQAGGAVLFCGGVNAFGFGCFGETSLAEWLPCQVGSEPDRQPLGNGMPLTPTAAAANVFPADLAWVQQPRVFYRHAVTPRPDATVWLTAGGQPVLLVRAMGKGRVAAWCCTPEGDPSPAQLAFWEWGDLGRCTAAICARLIQPTTAAASYDMARESAALLRASNSLMKKDDPQVLSDAFRLLEHCRNKPYAHALIEAFITSDTAVEGSGDFGIPLAIISALVRAVRPYVDADGRALIAPLLASADAGRRALGLRLVAIADPAKVCALLPQLAKTGLWPDDEENGSEDRGIENVFLQRLVAVQALGDAGGPTAVEALRVVTKDVESQRPQAKNTDLLTGDRLIGEDIFVQALFSRLRLGDPSAVTPYCTAITEMALRKDWHQNYLDLNHNGEDPKQLKINLARSTTMVHLDSQRLGEMVADAVLLPLSVKAPLATEFARRSDPHLLPLAYRALNGQTGEATLALLPLVTTSSLRELRDFGYAALASCREEKVRTALADAQVTMAGSGKADDAAFAFAHLTCLPSARRKEVFTAAAAFQTDPLVNKLARHAVILLPEADRALPGIKAWLSATVRDLQAE